MATLASAYLPQSRGSAPCVQAEPSHVSFMREAGMINAAAALARKRG